MIKIKQNLLAILFSILMGLGGLFIPQLVLAGNDLVINCPDNATACSTVPSNTPLFNENNILPGNSFTQTLTINNFDTDEACDLVLTTTDKTSGQPVNIAQKIYAAIYSSSTTYFGSHAGGQVIESQTYQDLYDAGSISLGTLAPNNNLVVNWLAAFTTSAGNEYQAIETTFDFDVAITCGSPTAPPDGGGDGGGASDYVCEATVPVGTPVLSAVVTGPNTVGLSWTPVSPVTHYALIFTRNSDGKQYGSPNVGNVTNYTVTNLSAGESYSFQVFGVNDCAPGNRSNIATATGIGGVVLAPEIRPEGPGGEILGIEKSDDEAEGIVAGAIAKQCKIWKFYLPLIILLIETLVVLLIEVLGKKKPGFKKWGISLAILILLTIVFYILRDCDCNETKSFLAWLCQNYWIVASLVWGFLRTLGYAFIEEIAS